MDNIIPIKNKKEDKEIKEIIRISNEFGDLIVDNIEKGVDQYTLCAIIGDRLGELIRVSKEDKRTLINLVTKGISRKLNIQGE